MIATPDPGLDDSAADDGEHPLHLATALANFEIEARGERSDAARHLFHED